jgi:hypothetical protein
MDASSPTQELDLGRLLRMQAMVTSAAQAEATYKAGNALVKAYLSLRGEMLRILESDALADLRIEFSRLFPTIEYAPPYSPAFGPTTSARLAEVAHDAQISLRSLQGWIQGLIDELTLEQRLRLDAEARAALAAKPPTGFQQS